MSTRVTPGPPPAVGSRLRRSQSFSDACLVVQVTEQDATVWAAASNQPYLCREGLASGTWRREAAKKPGDGARNWFII